MEIASAIKTGTETGSVKALFCRLCSCTDSVFRVADGNAGSPVVVNSVAQGNLVAVSVIAE